MPPTYSVPSFCPTCNARGTFDTPYNVNERHVHRLRCSTCSNTFHHAMCGNCHAHGNLIDRFEDRDTAEWACPYCDETHRLPEDAYTNTYDFHVTRARGRKLIFSFILFAAPLYILFMMIGGLAG